MVATSSERLCNVDKVQVEAAMADFRLRVHRRADAPHTDLVFEPTVDGSVFADYVLRAYPKSGDGEADKSKPAVEIRESKNPSTANLLSLEIKHDWRQFISNGSSRTTEPQSFKVDSDSLHYLEKLTVTGASGSANYVPVRNRDGTSRGLAISRIDQMEGAASTEQADGYLVFANPHTCESDESQITWSKTLPEK